MFELLCIGLETRSPSEVSLDLFRDMSLMDWQRLRAMADTQCVSAIVFDGLKALIDAYGKNVIAPRIQMNDWKKFILNWIGVVIQVEFENKRQLEVLEDMASRWSARGCRVLVMKGLASGTMYPKPNHRSPGDIDCYLFDEYSKGNEIAREVGAKVDESWYKHSQIHYKGEMFENHHFFVHTRDGKRGKQLNDELVENLNANLNANSHLSSSVILPPVQWSSMFLTYHACAHFLSEGLRLKQLLDWSMLLKNHQNDIDWPSFYAFCERHHLRRFADAATSISEEYMCIRITNTAITSISPHAERILKSALYDNDFVFGTGEGRWHNRWHLVRNLFHYRWKYKDIYETSPWLQFWYYVSGFLFHLE